MNFMQLNEEQVNAKTREKTQPMSYPGFPGKLTGPAQMSQVA